MQDIRHFELRGMLDASEVLCLNLETLTLSLLRLEMLPRMNVEVRLGSNEATLLALLLETAPFYTPYETLLAAFVSGLSFSQDMLVRFREAATEEEMINLRIAVHGLRPKLKLFHLSIKALSQTGYQLIRLPSAE